VGPLIEKTVGGVVCCQFRAPRLNSPDNSAGKGGEGDGGEGVRSDENPLQHSPIGKGKGVGVDKIEK